MSTIITIDPDTKKSGVAIFDDNKIKSSSMPFFELINEIEKYDDPELYIEAGWLNHPKNFRYFGNVPRIASEVSARVGANHQVGKLFEEYAITKKIKYHLVKPLRKCWRGSDGKITNSEINSLLAQKGYEQIKKSNQDQRDAILILLNIL